MIWLVPMYSDVANSISPASRMEITQVEDKGIVMRGMKVFRFTARVDKMDVHYSMPNG
jgi:hypothetical protein